MAYNVEDGTYAHYRVLLVDDEPQITDVTEHLIRRRLGCTVRAAASGEEMLSILADEQFDVLLTDMMMPGLHGLELLNLVSDKWPAMDIIVMSGFVDDFPYVDIVKAGANDFIGKPYFPEELEAKLLRVLKEREMREASILAEMKYRSLFELSMNGMLLITPETYTIIDTNRSFCELCNRDREALLKTSLGDLLAVNERERLEQGLTVVEAGGQGTLGDLRLLRPDGKELSVDASATYIHSLEEKMVFLAFKDVTEKREYEDRLAEAAQTDQLTGLANKNTFNTRLEWAIARASGEKFGIVLMALDLDNFKACNDTYGHLVGDEVLANVGTVICDNIRAGGDEGFRCGGDEFAVLLVGAPLSIAEQTAERMRRQHEEGDSRGTTLSIGIAEHCQGMSATDLIRTADESLYKAKAQGKNKIFVAS